MPIISFADKTYTLNENESILECLIRHGINYPHSCQVGVCQSCLIKGRGTINPAWQEGIQDTLKTQGYFLACLAKPKEDIQLTVPFASECEIEAKIDDIKKLTYNVIQVKLYVKNLAPWTPGQYLNLINSEGIIRSYSIANIPNQDGFIELHIKLEEQGLMGEWFKKTAHVNNLISIRGPLGRCFYFNPNKLTYDILLVGTGTGLSPLIGIAKQALFQNHQGKITLLHGGRIFEDLYYVNELEKIASENSDFHYENCVWKNASGEYNLPIDKVVLKYIQDPKNLRVFVCGPQETTQKIKTKVFCAGVPSSQILSDAFI
ncbi:MAG: 2Fe-2S iron-sulfur cluster binding domain-containing protein [Coxiellaceae bacterium]|nr:2Fe-2S iron-sulfur cluster binding domain-containing protein [Coxiellaceae bacterium]